MIEPRLVSSAPGRSRERLAWMAVGVLGLTTLAGGIMTVVHVRESAPVAAPVAFTVTPPDGTTFITPQSTGLPWLAVSPDGRTLAFVALAADGRQQLWLRSLAAAAAWPLAATDDARAPFWSPDSRFIAFFAQGKLKYVEATGGTPQVLADAPRGPGGSWGRDNIIVFNRVAPTRGYSKKCRLAAIASLCPSRASMRRRDSGHIPGPNSCLTAAISFLRWRFPVRLTPGSDRSMATPRDSSSARLRTRAMHRPGICCTPQAGR